MNVGDKVRLIHGHEEGVIRKIKDNKIIEVEIEEGFLIPVLRSEVTLIAKEEKVHFSTRASIQNEETKTIGSQALAYNGIFIAFTEVNENQLSLHFLNNTDYDLLVSISQVIQQTQKGIFAQMVSSRTHQKVNDWYLKNFETWPDLLFQMIFHRKEFHNPVPVLEKTIKFKASTFFKTKQKITLLKSEGYLIQVDREMMKVDPNALKESLYSEKAIEARPVAKSKPEAVVDLHIEKLVQNFQSLTSAEIFNLQMNTFEKKLDQAIAGGLDNIVFIHGVGNGILRNAIHKKLSQVAAIQFYKDAMKDKFGYGATEVKIR
jgi:dsDNA-specific endonuclease/ATPase MutS2